MTNLTAPNVLGCHGPWNHATAWRSTVRTRRERILALCDCGISANGEYLGHEERCPRIFTDGYFCPHTLEYSMRHGKSWHIQSTDVATACFWAEVLVLQHDLIQSFQSEKKKDEHHHDK